ncbi:MAG: hypothetical protein AB7I27_11600 [Bacteriovoracaceae bacterium]
MRLLIGIAFVVLIFSAGLGYKFMNSYPTDQYSNWLNGKGWNKYYAIENYKQLLLVPQSSEEVIEYQEDYGQLWKTFPIRNSLVPLPTRHPLYKTVPIVEFVQKNHPPQFGMVFFASNDRELLRIYTLDVNHSKDYSHGQELFKLPVVRNRIKKIDQQKLWKDIFTYKIEDKKKTLEEMIYDLYILHIRSKFFPEETLRYGLNQDKKLALIELKSKDKDYKIEIVMNEGNGSIYSYIIKTEKNNPESQKLRAKFLSSIGFSPIDPGIGKLLYTEFKQLNFARQVDQEGMLYLFSAWSQDFENTELLKAIIFYLERGRNNSSQLKAFYQYAFKAYGKTFTGNKNAQSTAEDEQELSLQRKIDLEEAKRKSAAEKSNPEPVAPELGPDEKMNLYLKKAKENSKVSEEDMTVH